MPRRLRNIGVLVAVLVAGVTAVGALSAPEDGAGSALPAGSVAVVVGGHAGTPPARLTGRAAQATDLAATQGARLSVVVADGAPFVSTLEQLPGGEGADGRAANQQRIDRAVSSATARTSETDLLAALVVAGEQLGAGAGLRTVIVDGSGLSTSGAIDFTRPGMLEADPDDVASYLSDVGRLPDFSGALVIFQGLGEAVDPQPPLDGVSLARLRAVWVAVAERAGALDVQVETGLGGEESPAGLPPVSLVRPAEPASCSGNVIQLRGGPVSFQPGTSSFVDPDGAVALLTPIGQRMIADGLTAEVFGTYPAVGEPTLGKRLSEERAQAVANVLIDLGVPVSQLRVRGLGSDFEGYLPDRDEQGHLLPAEAALNRLVQISYSRDGQEVDCE